MIIIFIYRLYKYLIRSKEPDGASDFQTYQKQNGLKGNGEIQNIANDTENQSGGSTLVTCPDCGHQISALALSCPSCGRPINTSRKITFTRTKKMMGAGESQEVYINERLVGELRNGGTITVQEACNTSLSIFTCNAANASHTGNALTVSPGTENVNIKVEIFGVRACISFD